jgi:hypothetical protein
MSFSYWQTAVEPWMRQDNDCPPCTGLNCAVAGPLKYRVQASAGTPGTEARPPERPTRWRNPLGHTTSTALEGELSVSATLKEDDPRDGAGAEVARGAEDGVRLPPVDFFAVDLGGGALGTGADAVSWRCFFCLGGSATTAGAVTGALLATGSASSLEGRNQMAATTAMQVRTITPRMIAYTR